MTETLFTVREVVEKGLVGYKARTVRKLINSKKIRSVNLSEPGQKRSIRIPQSAINEFIESKQKRTPLD